MKEYLNPESPFFVIEEFGSSTYPTVFHTYGYLWEKWHNNKWGRYRLSNGEIFDMKAEYDKRKLLDELPDVKNSTYTECHGSIPERLSAVDNMLKDAQSRCSIVYLIKFKG